MLSSRPPGKHQDGLNGIISSSLQEGMQVLVRVSGLNREGVILWQQWGSRLLYSEGKIGLTEPFPLGREHRWLIDTFSRHSSDRASTFMQLL